MQPSELALYTTQELIAELMHRSTFLGVVIHSEQDWKGTAWGDERIFKVRFNDNLDRERAGRLLGAVAQHMDHDEPA